MESHRIRQEKNLYDIETRAEMFVSRGVRAKQVQEKRVLHYYPVPTTLG